jgi:hypothetical protein
LGYGRRLNWLSLLLLLALAAILLEDLCGCLTLGWTRLLLLLSFHHEHIAPGTLPNGRPTGHGLNTEQTEAAVMDGTVGGLATIAGAPGLGKLREAATRKQTAILEARKRAGLCARRLHDEGDVVGQLLRVLPADLHTLRTLEQALELLRNLEQELRRLLRCLKYQSNK